LTLGVKKLFANNVTSLTWMTAVDFTFG